MIANRMCTVGLIGLMLGAAGCEGYYRHSIPPTDLSEPPQQVAERLKSEGTNIADELEEMSRLRHAYATQLTRLEKIYLEQGDTVRANWARRQRENAENVYPFATNRAPEQTAEVNPEQNIPEADELYAQAESLINSFRIIPLAGMLEANQKKAAQAVAMLKDLIKRHPKSDKVDDAAFWIGECYKEYLREDDPDNALALRYYRWSWELDPRTPHPPRFQSAVVYDFRLRNHTRALELYRQVLEENESGFPLNLRFAAERITQLTDDERSPDRPREEREPRVLTQVEEPDANTPQDDGSDPAVPRVP